MFTGIITDIGTIRHREGGRIEIACAYAPDSIALGESIACSGVCLTVVDIIPSLRGAAEAIQPSPGVEPDCFADARNDTIIFAADISAETIARTAPGMWEQGKRLNLERSLRVGDALSGHFVSGHVDGVATIERIVPVQDSHRLDLRAPDGLAKFIAEKGSVTLDGVSLTVNSVNGSAFSVNIIPHTWAVTTLADRRAGDSINLEIDLLARYLMRMQSC